MANKDIEIEIKLPLRNVKEVHAFLDSKGKLLGRDEWQKDTYFIPAHRNFLEPKFPFEWLRVRETPVGNSLNYKHFYPEQAEKHDYCDEFSSIIDKPESVKKIFLSLNFKEIIVVEKSRSVWEYKNVEIAIDDVKNLGFYIELEAKQEFSDAKAGKEYLRQILSELNADTGAEDLRGYPYLVLAKQGEFGSAG